MDELIISSNGTNYIPNDTNEKCFVSMGNLIHYAKEMEKTNVMIAVFMRTMRSTILHTKTRMML